MSVVPPLSALKANYPTAANKELAEEMGFTGAELQSVLALWENTCAIRASYCLLQCGVTLGTEPKRGNETKIRAGKSKGKHFWMSRAKLSAYLRSTTFGKPAFEGEAKSEQGYAKLVSLLGKSGGVISFEALDGDFLNDPYSGGHIDVVYYDGNVITGGLGDRYDLMIESVAWFRTRGFSAQCSRATSVKFWPASSQTSGIKTRR